jgi:hypothetical protein
MEQASHKRKVATTSRLYLVVTIFEDEVVESLCDITLKEMEIAENPGARLGCDSPVFRRCRRLIVS